jgi:tetratricopeptide (TPR) repeat protein
VPQILVSFTDRRVRFGRKTLFRTPLQSEFFALLALTRLTSPADQAWISLDQIERLPSWKGKRKHDISTNVGRYLQSIDAKRLIESRTTWGGPYRLSANPLSVAFDVSLDTARKRLRLSSKQPTEPTRDATLQFTRSYARAQWLFFRGRLIRHGDQIAADDAYGALMQMIEHREFGVSFRLLAMISAADVLYRLGRFRVAREALQANRILARQAADLSLKARYHLSLAWAYQRSSSGLASDRAVKAALAKGTFYAENSVDRVALAVLAYRKASFLTKKGRLDEAVATFVEALRGYLITGNYHGVQASCADIGSVLHRIGPERYPEARRWILSSIGIARLMRIGRDDAHGEMILGKMYLESGKPLLSRLMLLRAERIARNAGNRVNRADIRMVWGFWFQRFGTREDLIRTLVEAIQLFRSMSEFDVPQKESYIQKKFTEVRPDVQQQLGGR